MDKFIKCGHTGCKHRASYRIRQANGFIGYVCGRHVKGEKVIEQVDLHDR